MSTRRRILKKRIKRLFPRLRSSSFRITSGPTPCYNCIAWAVGRNDHWWEYRRGYTWPNASRNPSVAAAIELFVGQGYERCESAAVEQGWEKVAIYGDKDCYTHAARQLTSGKWTSKLGKLYDIEHTALDDLAGGDYGEVVSNSRWLEKWPKVT